MVVPWVARTILAEAPKRWQWDPRLLWASLALIAALLFGALLIAIYDRWRKRQVQDRPPPSDQLAEFRSLYERGELSQEEFDRIKTLLTGQMREALNMPAAPAPNTANPPPPEPPPPSGPEPSK